jgi:signal transduction histidine kinase
MNSNQSSTFQNNTFRPTEHERPPEDAEITQAQFTQMMEDPFSFFITQQLTVGNVRSISRLYTEIVVQPELQFRLQAYFEKMQALGFLAFHGDEIVVNKMGFRFKLDKRSQGRLLPALFEISTNAAIRAVDQGQTAPILFLISEDPVTAAEVSAAVEGFRKEMRAIGERVKAREPHGVRAIGLFNTPMLAQDYLVTAETPELQATWSPGTVARRLGEVAQAAHDMAPALRSLDVVLAEARDQLDSDTLNLLELAAERIKKVYQDLLPTNRRKSESNTADASACAHAAFTEISMINQGHVQMEYVGSLSGASRVSIAPYELTRAIANILKNATEAVQLRKDGQVLLEVNESDETITITVQDNGPGFDPTLLDEVRRSRWMSSKPGGCGLGLRHATEVAQKAGGDLTIESTPGQGTSVRMEIPRLHIR